MSSEGDSYPPAPAVLFLSKRLGQLIQKCPICSLPALVDQSYTSAEDLIFPCFCSRCGSFQFTQKAYSLRWEFVNERQIANASGYIRENQGYLIKERSDLEFLKSLRTPSVAERAHKLLRALAHMFPIAGTEISLGIHFLDNQLKHFRSYVGTSNFPSDPKADEAALRVFPYLGMSWVENESELSFLLIKYLCENVGYLEVHELHLNDGGYDSCQVSISPKGWEFLDSVGLADSSTGFVAMWFDASMERVWKEAIHPGIADAGYSPLRIDKREHNNKIDDEILASIRKAKFILADFTGGRGGVYYEAGFASGLNIPVIWSVREDFLEQLHFDTRQFNHIAWRDDKLPDFRSALKNRIEATLGRGPAGA